PASKIANYKLPITNQAQHLFTQFLNYTITQCTSSSIPVPRSASSKALPCPRSWPACVPNWACRPWRCWTAMASMALHVSIWRQRSSDCARTLAQKLLSRPRDTDTQRKLKIWRLTIVDLRTNNQQLTSSPRINADERQSIRQSSIVNPQSTRNSKLKAGKFSDNWQLTTGNCVRLPLLAASR